MKYRRLMWGLGGILVFFSVSFLVPTIIAFIYDNGVDSIRTRPLGIPGTSWNWLVPETALVFLTTGTITATVGLLLQYFGVEEDDLRSREAYAIVGVGWLLIAAFGALPYLALGALTSPVDAFFESMSGFTTTGATVLTGNLQSYPPSLMMWRAFEQWVGGMGIIVLSIALLAGLTQGGHQLMSAETPGLKLERIRPKIAQTAKLLWGLYMAFSVLLFVVLTVLIHTTGVRLPMGEAVYEGMLHTFTAVSTGGFSNHAESIAYFDSVWVEVAVSVTLVASVLSFSLHYLAWKDRSLKRFFRDPETRFYAALIVTTCMFVALVLAWKTPLSFWESMRQGWVQTIAIVTTAGFTPYNFNEWPDTIRLILLFMFFTGGAAGSTAGGLKVIRILLLFKLVVREMRKLLHPRAVIPIRMGKSVVSDDVIKTVSVFFFAYITLFIAGTIALTLMEMDMISAISASAAAIGNIGPGLGSVFSSYADVPDAGKLLLTLLMWFGRLEIFTVLILFSRETWRR